MKNLKYFFTFCLLSSLFLTSCTKENPIDLQILDDSELIVQLHESDAVAGTGIVKESSQIAFNVDHDDLPATINQQLLSKAHLDFTKDVKISNADASRIWGNKIPESISQQGLTIPQGQYQIKKSYMTPDGVNMTQAVNDNPDLLNADTIDDLYWIAVYVLEYDDDGNIIGATLVYFEACYVIIE